MKRIKNFLIITGIMIILAGMMGCSVMMAPAFSGCTASKEEQEKSTKPVLSAEKNRNLVITEDTIRFTWTGNIENGTITDYEYSKDGKEWQNNGLSTSYSWSGYTDGEHTLEVRAKNNEGEYSETIKWRFLYIKKENFEFVIEDYSGEQGGTLNLSAESGPKTFNNAWAQETSSTEIIDIFLDSLIGADNRGEPSDTGLAKEWWLSEDKKTVYYEIRQGLQWSDGEPFTVEDVVWTFEEIYFVEGMTANGPAGYYDSNDKLPEIDVSGKTVSFTWTEPSFWGFRAVSWTNILPKHILAEEVNSGSFKNAWGVDDIDELVGMGPFIPTKYKKGEEMVMERNPYYYRVDRNYNRLPYLDKISYKIYSASNSIINALEKGEIDLLSPHINYYNKIKKDASKKGLIVGEGGPVSGSTFIAFNLVNEDENKREWFRNVHFRRALSYLLDRKSLIASFYNNLATPLYGPVTPFSPYYNPEIEDEFAYNYSVIKARLELKKGGFDWDEEGNLIDEKGNKVKFELITNSGTRETISNILKESAEKVGINISVKTLEFNILVDKLTKPDYDAVTIGLTGGSDPGSGHNTWRLDGGLHFFNYSPELRPGTVSEEIYEVFDWEQRIHDIFVESTGAFGEERKELFDEFQMIFAEYQPLIFTIAQNYLYAYQGNVHIANPEPNPFAGMLWKIQCIWKEE